MHECRICRTLVGPNHTPDECADNVNYLAQEQRRQDSINFEEPLLCFGCGKSYYAGKHDNTILCQKCTKEAGW